jgi:hypothetical protein
MKRESSSKRSSAAITAEEASAAIKAHAKHKIRIRLTPEQMDAIVEQWNEVDPRSPAEITFYVGRRPVANLKVAGYRYRGDTCCV